MGLLDSFLGAPGSTQSQALGLLAGHMVNGQFGNGLLAANQHFANEPQRAMQQQLAQMQLEQHRMTLDKARRDDGMEKSIFDAAKSSFRTPEQAIGLSTGPMPDGSAMPTVKPGFDSSSFINQLYGINPMRAVAFEQSIAKDNSPLSVAPGASLVDRKTMKPVFTAPDKADRPPSAILEYQFAQGQGYKGTFDQYQKDLKRAGASSVSVNTGQKGLDNELKIRSDFRSEPVYKAHQEVQSAYSQITQALKQQSPAGDLAGATKIMKILDPGSVVRESELGMAMAATGAMDRLVNYADMVMKGTKLTPSQRADFQALADRLHGESVNQYNAKRSEYGKFAKDYGLDGERILGPAITSPKLPGAPQGPKFLGFE